MPLYTSYDTFLKDYREDTVNCEKVVTHYLAQIEATKDNNIYIEVFTKDALQKAKALDLKAKSSQRQGRLFGMVISIKDNICYQGKSVTAASKILEGFVSTYTATAIEKLEAEDAIIIGRVNCDEFGMGSASSFSAYGPVKHPLQPEFVPGGSSGGCAAAVLADTCFASIGTDTGGSIRQPAAFCGLVGAKPTYGSISRYGIIAYASSFDQVGAITHKAEESQLLIDVMKGLDSMDPTTLDQLKKPATSTINKKIKVAYFDNALTSDSIDPFIKQETLSFIDQLAASPDCEVSAIPFEYLDLLVPTYYVLTTAEASSNLARYDGVRYGKRVENPQNLEELYKKTRTEGFGDEVKRRIMLGTFVLSATYYDAYYTKAQKVRKLISNYLHKVFSSYDFIVMPTSPIFPWKIGSQQNDLVATYLADIFTVLPNLYGGPAVSMPLKATQQGFNVNIQILAAARKDDDLFVFLNKLQNNILN